MIETYKILKRYYDLDPSTFFTLNTATTRGYSLKLFKERSRLLVRQNIFTNRITNLYGIPYLTLSFQHQQLQPSSCAWIIFGSNLDMGTFKGLRPSLAI